VHPLLRSPYSCPRRSASRGRDQGELDYGAKYPKAVARIVDDADDAAAP
jgi:hypothetical protein